MFQTDVQWHKASEELPEKSCEVVVARSVRNGVYDLISTDYSFKHKTFYCVDNSPNRIVKNSHTFSEYVDFWTYLDEFAKVFEQKKKKDRRERQFSNGLNKNNLI